MIKKIKIILLSLFILFLFFRFEVNSQTSNFSIPWDEVTAFYGETIVNNIKKMIDSGISPNNIRELDKWTNSFHFEYALPGGMPTGNFNIWVYDNYTDTIKWVGPGPAPYSSEEALKRLKAYLGEFNADSNQQLNLQSLQPTTTQLTNNLYYFNITLPQDNDQNYIAKVGDVVSYNWYLSGERVASWYTADAPDNCPGGLTRSGEIKPWVANNSNGFSVGIIQSCQEGRTYTITIENENGQKITRVIKVLGKDNLPVMCTGNLRTDFQSAKTCIELAEKEGQERGYNIDCRVEKVLLPFTDITTNRNYYLNTVCNVNGFDGFDAKLLAGYYRNGKIVNQIGWNTLTEELKRQESVFIQLPTEVIPTSTLPISTPPISTFSTSTSKIVKKIGKPSNEPIKLRYLKDEILISGWVAIREVKFYDKDGKEIKPVTATASCNWCNYGTPPDYSVGPNGVFDGKWDKVWNAGETAPGCNWYTGKGCPPLTIRQAWIKIDFGREVEIARILIQPMGDSQNRIDILTGSLNDKDYFDICTIKATPENPLKDRGPDGDWIECNIATY